MRVTDLQFTNRGVKLAIFDAWNIKIKMKTHVDFDGAMSLLKDPYVSLRI